MKIPMFIAALGVAAALVVPIASGAVRNHLQVSGTVKPRPVYIYVPPPSFGFVMPTPAVGDCPSSETDCTPLIWGESCSATAPQEL